jgi:hypothetical protein
VTTPLLARERWLRQWVAACRVNVDDPDINAVAYNVDLLDTAALDAADLLFHWEGMTPPRLSSSPRERTRIGLDWLRHVVPHFRFEGARHRMLSLADVRRSRRSADGLPWWACGDASAAVAALALRAGCASVFLVVEELPQEHQAHSAVAHSYAHAQIVADGETFDAVLEMSLKAGRRVRRENVRELLRWPTVGAPTD